MPRSWSEIVFWRGRAIVPGTSWNADDGESVLSVEDAQAWLERSASARSLDPADRASMVELAEGMLGNRVDWTHVDDHELYSMLDRAFYDQRLLILEDEPARRLYAPKGRPKVVQPEAPPQAVVEEKK